MAKTYTYKIKPILEDGDWPDDGCLIIKVVFGEDCDQAQGPIITPERYIEFDDWDDDGDGLYIDLVESGKGWPNYFKFIESGWQNATHIVPMCKDFQISCISIVEK